MPPNHNLFDDNDGDEDLFQRKPLSPTPKSPVSTSSEPTRANIQNLVKNLPKSPKEKNGSSTTKTELDENGKPTQQQQQHQQSSQQKQPRPPSTTFFYLFIASLSAAINHHSYLILIVLLIALCSQYVSIYLTIFCLVHVIISGFISCTLALRENPYLPRPERLARQHGHTLLLTHFGGVGSLGELFRLHVDTPGVEINNVIMSILYQFITITPIKIITLVTIYIQINSAIKLKLEGLNLSDGQTHFSLDLLWYLGYATFIVLCGSFILPIISYVFAASLDENEEDEYVNQIEKQLKLK